MKFEIEKKVLLKSLEDVAKSIDSNNIYVQLRNFYIVVLDNMVIIRGSNGYFSIESKIEQDKIISIEKIGKTLIPASLLMNIVKKCDGKIKFIIEEKTLLIINNEDKYEINMLDPSEFPSIDFSLYGEKIIINAKKLKGAIDGVIFASSQSSEEIILTGVNLKYQNKKLYVSATDSFRLAQEIIEIEDDRNISFDVTITNKNIKNFIPSNVDDDVILYVNEHKINLIKETTNFQSKIIDAPYKDISNIFNINFSKKLVINKSVLSNSINKATLVTGVSESSFNKLSLTINKEKIDIRTNTDEIGKANVIISKENYEYEGDEISITLNYKFLKEAINIFSDNINIYLIDGYKPIMINDDKRLNKQIISPMMS